MTKEELEKEKCELLGIIQGKDKAIQDLQKENARLKEKCNSLQELVTYYQINFCQEGYPEQVEITKDVSN